MTKSVKITVENQDAISNVCSGCSGCTTTVSTHSQEPTIKVIAGLNPSHQHGTEYDHADLLILTKVPGMDLGPGPMAFDAQHGGVINQAIASHDFKGDIGEQLIIELPPETTSGRLRHIAIVGLGKAEDVSRRRMCDLFNYALALACRYQAESLLIPVFPHRSSAQALNLRGTGAILRCLVDQQSRRGSLETLKEVRLLCAPQAKRHLQAGIAVDRTLCNICTQCNIPALEQCSNRN